MRKLALCLAVVGLAGPARAQERPPVIRLAALIAEAREKNPEVRAARAQARAAASSVAPAGAFDDPMLMVELWNAPVDFSTVPVMFQLTQTVPLGGKRAEMAQPVAAERATGYVTGGISPIGQRRRLPVVIDLTALDWPTVFCSAGQRGLEIELAPADLVRATGGQLAAIARPQG